MNKSVWTTWAGIIVAVGAAACSQLVAHGIWTDGAAVLGALLAAIGPALSKGGAS